MVGPGWLVGLGRAGSWSWLGPVGLGLGLGWAQSGWVLVLVGHGRALVLVRPGRTGSWSWLEGDQYITVITFKIVNGNLETDPPLY